MVDIFLNNLRFEKRYSAHTITAYQSDLLQFTDFLITNFELSFIEKASPQHVRSYLAQLMDKGIAARSVQRKLICLKSFYKFLLQEEIIKKSPLLRIKMPKSGSVLPVYIEEKEMQQLYVETAEDDDFTARRNNLIVQMFYQTGMRLSELKNLKTADVNLFKSELKVLGKRNKERIIPFTNELKQTIANYLSQKNKIDVTNDDMLFVLDNGKPLYEKFIYRVVTSALGSVTTSGKKSPHVLRHTYATHLMNNGANISSIKELLGHGSLASTQIYTHNSIEQLKRAHPKGTPPCLTGDYVVKINRIKYRFNFDNLKNKKTKNQKIT